MIEKTTLDWRVPRAGKRVGVYVCECINAMEFTGEMVGSKERGECGRGDDWPYREVPVSET